MTAIFIRSVILLFIIMLPLHVAGQVKKFREYKRTFQFSLFPGISTNGIESGFYYNNYSFNLFGGLSAGNRVVEVGLISNVNMQRATGIQLAGFANVIGTNAFLNLTLWEERSLISDDYESSNKGIQIAGLLNYVRNNTSAFQLAGLLNVVGEDFEGIQLAGMGNSSGGTVFGLQLAGLYNLSKESVGGFQISSLFNYTDEQLSGMQIAIINKARYIKGGKSTPPTNTRGLQIGLINHSKEMDGVQIGLINFGGAARGKQIGLINFFHRMPIKEYGMMGTPIGLLNFGSNGSVLRLYYNESFPVNLQYTTGNCLNCSWTQSGMPFYQNNRKFNQNALILGYDPFRDMWGFGYGFQKLLYNKVTMLPKPDNEKRLISYGVKFLHMNRNLKLDRSFNLLSRVNIDWGKRRGSVYFYGGVSFNYFLYKTQEIANVYKPNSVVLYSGKALSLQSSVWPGYEIGMQML